MIELMDMDFCDLDEVCEMERECFPVPWTRSMFENELCMPDRTIYLVARENTRLIGYIGVSQIQNEGHITTIAVDDQYRRQGVASGLLLRTVAEAVRRQIDIMTLEVRVSNWPAQNLYLKFGFKVVGLRKNYYPETGEDALIMTATNIEDILAERG